ncbi:helix-turn-helix domain-containing protein [Herbiconiux sp. CPCC 203407]|uniref:Helix-turn-helix domain-containing protein n=1 Tax=Herbiconiux oxytropis TaxID=2970915 RepID=A0AA41XIA4_9MICO|nr:helix-turn-helix domain-containing protein [Herbiconiux oxytropis]MCS5723627.1 helix-turn-helix domain-containing protein [Herbiconiux oxytropis]MCS5726944.1 helix-turn-helix domain-containing protein [Herbiconiux oxytropis]
MQELVGRLTALDAEATETLKVIAYFDALVDGHASLHVLVRGAAILSGCATGFVADDRSLRVDAAGMRSTGSVDVSDLRSSWPSHGFGDAGLAWIERDGPAHANDGMILERLAIALDIAVERTSPAAASRRALSTLVDPDSSADTRLEAAGRLHLDTTGSTRYRVIATPASAAATGPSIVIGSPAGHVRVFVREVSSEPGSYERAGIGIATASDGLDRSSASALTALRLTSRYELVVHADQLGAARVFVETVDDHALEAPDVQALAELIRSQPRAEHLLHAITGTDSLRAVALELGLHHSTVQARVAALGETLGFDIRSPRGRTRLSLALLLHRFSAARFD